MAAHKLDALRSENEPRFASILDVNSVLELGYASHASRDETLKGTKVAALDSAKQTHYLPAFMNIQAWFGSTQDCINAAVTSRWNGVAP